MRTTQTKLHLSDSIKTGIDTEKTQNLFALKSTPAIFSEHDLLLLSNILSYLKVSPFSSTDISILWSILFLVSSGVSYGVCTSEGVL